MGSRRVASATLVLALLMVALAGTTVVPIKRADAQAARNRRPNILIIVTDDQRADDTMKVMPKTRRLFRRGGTTYSNGVVTTPTCCPSRSSIFTGQYVHNHGVTNNNDGYNLNQDHTIQTQ